MKGADIDPPNIGSTLCCEVYNVNKLVSHTATSIGGFACACVAVAFSSGI